MNTQHQVKSVAIIGSVGLPAKYGGWETLVNYLTRSLANDFNISVYCSKKKYPFELESYNGAKLKYINFDANGPQSIPYDIVSMWKAMRDNDTILVLGISGCIALPFFRLFSRPKFIVNIDGLEWKRDKWGIASKAFLWLSEFIAVKSAHIVVADNLAIQSYIDQKYNVASVFIPYGADHVADSPPVPTPKKSRPYAFKVCRIEPENSVHVILEAFSKQNKFDLVIVGNWQNSAYGQSLYNQFKSVEGVILLDPIYDLQELNNLRGNCTIYVHGHAAGGTNPSLVEAMYLGLPILAKRVSYNVSTTFNAAVYFEGAKDLLETIATIDAQSLDEIGRSMKNIARENYTWAKVAKSYSTLF